MPKATADSGVNIAIFIDSHVPNSIQTVASSNILVVSGMAIEVEGALVGAQTTTATALVVSAATAIVPTRIPAEHLEVSLRNDERFTMLPARALSEFSSVADLYRES